MGRPLKSVFKKEHRDDISNRSANPVFSEVAEVFLSRRRFLQMGAVAGAAVSFPYLITPENAIAAVSKPSALAKAVSLGFTSIDVSTEDTVRVPEGYIARPFYRWGDPTGIKNNMPAFKPDASNTQTNRPCRRACTTTAWRGLACRRGGKARSMACWR